MTAPDFVTARSRDTPPMTTTAPLLDVVDVHTTFASARGPVQAVDGVSLRLERGHTLGIVGESGSGKSILLRSIMGLLPERGIQRSGSVFFDGQDLAHADRKQLSRIWGARIGMVFQDPMSALNPVVPIGRQITEVLHHHRGLGRRAARQRALELLDQVGIADPELRVRQYPHQLSGGLRQRVLIAAAIACAPDLLLADEPTTALDATVEAEILDLLFHLQRELGMAMILVTHNLGVAADRTDEIAVMYAGRVVEKAPTHDLFARPRMPYTAALIESTPTLDISSHTRLQAIPGRPPDPVHRPAGCAFAPRCRFAQPRCAVQRPELTGDDPAHTYACWYPLNSDAPAEDERDTKGVAG